MKRILMACLLAISSSAFAADPAIADNPFGAGQRQISADAPIQTKHHKAVHHHAANDHHYGSGSDSYTNVSGHRVHRPVHASSRPAGATAHCRDGSWSFSEHHRGTCSHHGGVSGW